MEQNVKSSGLTLADILRMFRGKVILVVCITLVAAILGGVFGVVSSLFYADYGTSVEFYVSHVDSKHAILPILQSESFAEKLLLDENGLPAKDKCNPADYEAALAAINATKAAREAKYDAKKALDRLPLELAAAEKTYEVLSTEYLAAETRLGLYTGEQAEDIVKDEGHKQKIKECEDALQKIAEIKDDFLSKTYYPLLEKKSRVELAFKDATDALNDARRNEEELVGKVLSDWRSSAAVQESLKKIHDSVSFSYGTGEGATPAENYNFIVVTVLVPSDEDYAANLLGKIKSIAPDFIENNIEDLTGEVEVDCTLMSTFSAVGDLNDSGIVKTALIYALVAAVAIFALTCIVIIGINLVKKIFAVDDEQKAESETKQEDKTYTNV